MDPSSSPDSVHHCVTSNGLPTSGDPLASVESLQTEVLSLRNELSKKQDLLVKLQDRERQLRERSVEKQNSLITVWLVVHHLTTIQNVAVLSLMLYVCHQFFLSVLGLHSFKWSLKPIHSQTLSELRVYQ